MRDWHTNKLNRLPGLKFQRTLWLSSVAGGPQQFKATVPGKCPLSLENAHKKFQISPKEFDEVTNELSLSLDEFTIPNNEKNEVLAAFLEHKPEIDIGYDLANDITPPIVKCPFT